jgi:glycosyltransferase involved in cell wall biosynthesis
MIAPSTTIDREISKARFVPSLAIVLATYNGERYLAKQLDSIRRQTSSPTELIVSDDGSTDSTMNLVRDFAKNASFPVHIHQNQTRLGYRANFMQAAAACSSDLIAFCDQDDIWSYDKLARMRIAFDNPEVLLVYHNATLINDDGIVLGTTCRQRAQKTFGPLSLYPWTIIPGMTQALRRSLLRLTPLHADSIDPYALREAMPHDQWFPFWASVLGDIAYIPDSLAQYRQHGANESGWPAHYLAYALDHVRNAEQYIAGNAVGAKNRIDLLKRCRDLLDAHEHERIADAEPYYAEVSAASDRRLALYRDTSLTGRVRTLAALTRDGAYTGRRSDAWGFDALLLDAFIGIPFKRLGRPG